MVLPLSVSPPGGDVTEPVTQSCLRTTGTFLMLDTSLGTGDTSRQSTGFQSYSLYAGELSAHTKKKSLGMGERSERRERDITGKKSPSESCKIIGIESIQDQDRLLLHTAEMIRSTFLCQMRTPMTPSPLLETLSAVKNTVISRERKGDKTGASLSEIISNHDTSI